MGHSSINTNAKNVGPSMAYGWHEYVYLIREAHALHTNQHQPRMNKDNTTTDGATTNTGPNATCTTHQSMPTSTTKAWGTTASTKAAQQAITGNTDNEKSTPNTPATQPAPKPHNQH